MPGLGTTKVEKMGKLLTSPRLADSTRGLKKSAAPNLESLRRDDRHVGAEAMELSAHLGYNPECIAFPSHPEIIRVTVGTRGGPVPEPCLHTFVEARESLFPATPLPLSSPWHKINS